MSQGMYTTSPLIGGSLFAMGGAILMTHPGSGTAARVGGGIVYGFFTITAVWGAISTLSVFRGAASIFLAIAAAPAAWATFCLASGPIPLLAIASGAVAGFFALAAVGNLLFRLVRNGEEKDG